MSVEIGRVNSQIERIESEVRSFAEKLPEGPAWPTGASPPSRPPNRYQVERYFTLSP